ncbi:PTS glucose transporter subunit IIA [Caproiciproducens galactitolivorans]|uniref:Glucose-specific phosphotransferase enzyme IIA component n=2 Tax=Caproiciproducens galactitolivorans TaxID=642589 RepID=A0A4Z0YF26_9FIRM|nr:PTS glucose transporter subunit IIA [Caproiciproducens galactitolivorans]TGJ75562.1 glucose-specific phosphotransferase enzyme IIA component [Caproiciproducens galactitolivorans]
MLLAPVGSTPADFSVSINGFVQNISLEVPMGLFTRKKKKFEILAPLTGKAVPVSETPDSVFSGKVLGDGVTILPENGEVVAPVAGKVVNIAHSYHALCIEGDDGAEVLIHLGINTVELKGKGFCCHIKQGDHVQAGQKLMNMDLEFIKEQGYSTASPCIVTNLTDLKNLSLQTGDAKAGETVVVQYEK